jgi:hypothetical protein
MSKDGGPAFPKISHDLQYKQITSTNGISIRDYFAAKAMQALLSEPKVTRDLMLYAGAAYEVADAMLEAREQ